MNVWCRFTKIISQNLNLLFFVCLVFIFSTDAAVPWAVVQSCRSVGESPAGGSAEPPVVPGSGSDPPSLLRPQPLSGSSR